VEARAALERYQEAEQVRRDKHRRLLLLGYRRADADFLCELDLDLHRLQELLKRGCPHDVAARIVS
jgi:hypothetical protein